MPHLQYAGYRWNLGEDDLAFPAFWVTLIRSVWLIFMIVILILSTEKIHNCHNGSAMYTYFSICFLIYFSTILLNFYWCFVIVHVFKQQSSPTDATVLGSTQQTPVTPP